MQLEALTGKETESSYSLYIIQKEVLSKVMFSEQKSNLEEKHTHFFVGSLKSRGSRVRM